MAILRKARTLQRKVCRSLDSTEASLKVFNQNLQPACEVANAESEQDLESGAMASVVIGVRLLRLGVLVLTLGLLVLECRRRLGLGFRILVLFVILRDLGRAPGTLLSRSGFFRG